MSVEAATVVRTREPHDLSVCANTQDRLLLSCTRLTLVPLWDLHNMLCADSVDSTWVESLLEDRRDVDSQGGLFRSVVVQCAHDQLGKRGHTAPNVGGPRPARLSLANNLHVIPAACEGGCCRSSGARALARINWRTPCIVEMGLRDQTTTTIDRPEVLNIRTTALGSSQRVCAKRNRYMCKTG